jgi:ornithine cyclodeaminase/alanine dehydrogenase-like protein (mu-crystallin family)
LSLRRRRSGTPLGQDIQPNRMIVPLGDQGAVLSVMAGRCIRLYSRAQASAVIPENRFRGLAGHQGAVVLLDSHTSGTAALLHGGEITARRRPWHAADTQGRRRGRRSR